MRRQRLIQTRQYRSAMALVAVLWVIVLMMVLVSVAAQTSLLDGRVSQIENEKQRCRWACRAGVETAIALLLEDDRAYDGVIDLWADNPQELEELDLGGVTLTVQIVDEASKLNVNTVGRDQLLSLPDMTEDVADSLQDWIDSNDTVREGGAESGYYINLDHGYLARNATLRTTGELLRVKGVSEGLFYGDVEKASLSAENEGWVHYLTCWSQEINQDSEGNARVNVNLASARTLQSQLGLTEPQARWVSENRSYRAMADLMGKKSSSGQGSSTSTMSSSQRTQPTKSSTPQTRTATPQQSSGQTGQQQTPQSQQQSAQSSSGQSGRQQSQQTQQQSSGQTSQQSSRQGGQQSQQPPAEPLNWKTLLAASDKITMTNRQFIRGKVNINTAGLEVLTAVFEGNRELAQNIIAARQGQGGVFMSLSELEKIDGMSQDILKKQLDILTVRSSVFQIQATATSEATGLEYRVEAIVNRDAAQGQIYYWREGV